ncbi:LysE family translocator [Algicola sagamiensis]|uniref:LysE family translocator n=1 Tax=Algicola sagamiensis TaxID=163869 RepID=UPI00036DE283|nr:LysE family translocator [Algicola sagamiensis]
MTLTIWFSLFALVLLGAMTPGPSLAIIAKHALAGGRIHGLVAAWSHAIGIGVYACLSLLGLAVIFQESPVLFKVISYAGAAFLAYLGLNAFRAKGGIATKIEKAEKTSLSQAAREGFLISILNPKTALFFTALFSQFVAISHQMTDKFVLVSTPLIVDGLWFSFISFVLSRGRVLEYIRSRAVLIDRLSGGVLILLALRVIVTT